MSRPSLKVKTRSVGASKEVFTTETIDEMVKACEEAGQRAVFVCGECHAIKPWPPLSFLNASPICQECRSEQAVGWYPESPCHIQGEPT